MTLGPRSMSLTIRCCADASSCPLYLCLSPLTRVLCKISVISFIYRPDTAAAAAAGGGGGGSGIDVAFLSDVLWSDPAIVSGVSPASLRAIRESFGFSHLSKVQAATLPLLLKGSDCFAKVRP